jgi:DNA helicase HerA-like ATPase
LRAFTAKDQRDLARAAENYRPNPRFNTETAIKDVGTGEAVTSFLEAKGNPGMVERTLVRPPDSQLGPVAPEVRRAVMQASGLGGKYEITLDRESAYEKLAARSSAAAQTAQADPADDGLKNARRYDPGARPQGDSQQGGLKDILFGGTGKSGRGDSIAETFAKSAARTLGSRTGQQIVRGILGSIFKSR